MDIANTDSRFVDLSLPALGYSDTIVDDFESKFSSRSPRSQGNGAPSDLGTNAVPYGVLDQRLKNHAGDGHLQGVRVDLLVDPELIGPETQDFDVQIVVDEIDFLLQGHKMNLALQPAAEDVRQLQKHASCRVRIKADQRRHGIQSIEQEVRIDLADERIHTRLE